MDDILTLLYKKHQDWIMIVRGFGCNKDTAEDLVQEMYIKIKKKVDKGLDIMYTDKEVNYYYIFKTLNSLFLDLKKKEKNIYFQSIEDLNMTMEEKIKYTETYSIVKKELETFHWYDQKVYELIEGGESVASLSKKTNISYYSLYNTYKKVKKKLRNKIKL
jgi:DNA-directed RNA polymerase specialized sigma24 family protein